MRIILTIAVSLSLCGNAYAQADRNVLQPKPKLGPIGTAIEQKIEQGTSQAVTSSIRPLQELADLLASDFDSAQQLAVAIPDLQDGNGQQCWRVMGSAGAVFKEHPVPATLRLATDIEAVRLLFMVANRVCTNSACTQVFADGANVVQALGPVPIMSLNSICSKIPQIAVAPPLPPLPVTTPSSTPR